MLLSFELIGHKRQRKLHSSTWARSEAGLSRLPVTEKIAGSNPVGPAKKLSKFPSLGIFLLTCIVLSMLDLNIFSVYFQAFRLILN